MWKLFSRLQERRPGGFAIAALLRPPAAGENEALWLERARATAARGPLGHHTHFTAPNHARPSGAGAGEIVRREGRWFREQALRPTLFCGGGWYFDVEVAEAVAELGYADCTGTSFRPDYLPSGSPRLEGREPRRLRLPSGALLRELPTTHSLGMLARRVGGHLAVPVVHAYFHDTDLLDTRRRLALELALRLLRVRRLPADLDLLAEQAAAAPEGPLSLAG